MFQISVPGNLLSSVQLIPGHFKLANMKLNQFDILNKTISTRDDETTISANIIFQRQLMYYLANIYLPTISLLVIVEMTLFFDLSRQEVAVTLSLTVLLVMYTFYQSISTTIPKTAYLKLIDYWLIFCLLAPFVIFTITSIWYLDQTNVGKQKAKGWMQSQGPQQLQQNYFFQRKTVQYGVPFLTFVFIFLYFSCATYVYFCP